MFKPKKPNVPDRHLRWKYLPVKGGEKYELYVAGPPIGVELHWHQSSKPCRASITDNALSCDLCKIQMNPIWRAYLPCLSPILEQVVILYTIDYHELVSALPLHCPIIARRGTGGRDPVVIRDNRSRGQPLRFNGPVPPQADIRVWLLRLWNDKVLSDHLTGEDGKHQKMTRAAFAALPRMGESVTPPADKMSDPPKALPKLADLLKQRESQPPPDDAPPPPETSPKNGTHR